MKEDLMETEVSKLKTSDIQVKVASFLAERGHEHICENFGHYRFEMDVASLSKSGMLHEIEVKVSRGDFLKDAKKKGYAGLPKLESYKSGKDNKYTPNYFYYACPDGLINKSEIPNWAGLYYCDENGIRIIQAQKRIHSEPHDKEQILKKMLRMMVQRKYLGGCLMTFLNRRITERYNQQAAQSDTDERSVATTEPATTKS